MKIDTFSRGLVALAEPVGRRRVARRLVQLALGLVAYGIAIAILVRAELGLNPWDVFHQGLAAKTGLSFGTVLTIAGAAVLLLWVPLRQRPGIGTVANIFVIGFSADIALAVIPAAEGLAARWAMLGGGILLLGAAGAAYLAAGLGAGPRDGLMTGLSARTGWPIRRARTAIELAVLALGWLLGGTAGVGTIVFALAIGPVVQLFLPLFAIPDRAPLRPAACC
jgi:uncharacterized membrane protein YczE